MKYWILGALLVGFGTGCSGWTFTRTRAPEPLRAATLALAGDWAELTADALGNLTVEDEPLRLETVREYEHFGIVLANASDLPASLRPAHLADGGVVVTGLAEASPLAIHGVRVLDRLLEIEGVPVEDARGAMDKLLERKQGHQDLRISRQGVDSKKITINVDRDQFLDSFTFGLPFVCTIRDAPLTSGWSLGPGVLTVSSETEVGHDLSYVETSGWKAALGLIRWEKIKDLDTRAYKTSLRLGWFFTVYRGGQGENE